VEKTGKNVTKPFFTSMGLIMLEDTFLTTADKCDGLVLGWTERWVLMTAAQRRCIILCVRIIIILHHHHQQQQQHIHEHVLSGRQTSTAATANLLTHSLTEVKWKYKCKPFHWLHQVIKSGAENRRFSVPLCAYIFKTLPGWVSEWVEQSRLNLCRLSAVKVALLSQVHLLLLHVN